VNAPPRTAIDRARTEQGETERRVNNSIMKAK
jgi:hypothetical protein